MKRTHINDLGSDPIGRLLFRLAVPAILAQLINALYNIVDRIYIGHIAEIGPQALTGVGVAFPLVVIISAFSSLVGMGGAPRAAIKMGEGDQAGAQKILGNCVMLLLLLSVLLTAVFSIWKTPLLLGFGASEQTIGYASGYLGVYVLGTLFVELSLGLNAFISTQGFATTGMLTVLIGAVLNIILDPIFIFVFDLGVNGAAIATVISQAVSACWVVAFLLGKRTKLKIRLRDMRLRRQIILPVLALGISPFIMQSTESLVTISLNASLQRYSGDLAVGAMTIMGSVMQVAMMPMMGLTQSAQPIISYNYGARQTDRVRRTFRLLLCCTLGYSAALWVCVMSFPQLFIRLFSSDPTLMDMTVWGIRIYMGALFMLGAQNACQQTFVALGQAKISLFLALLRKIILLIPLIFILPAFLSDQVFAVFLAEPVADLLATSTTVLVFSLRFRKILAAPEGSVA